MSSYRKRVRDWSRYPYCETCHAGVELPCRDARKNTQATGKILMHAHIGREPILRKLYTFPRNRAQEIRHGFR